MHANVHADRDRGSWRLPQDETLQVTDVKNKKSNDLSYVYDGHNWRSIIFSLLVIGFVIIGIVTAIYLLGYVDELLYWSGRRMNFNEFLQNELNPKKLPSTWIAHNYLVFQADDGSLMLLDTENDTITTLVTNHTLVFRQSFTSHYTIYDINNDHHIPVRLHNIPKTQHQRLQFVTWLGSTSALILIVANDIYLRPSPISDFDYRLTFSGQSNVIYNGIADWLYQEEILRFPEAIWTSSDSTHILYATFNDSLTSVMSHNWLNTGSFSNPNNSNKISDNFPESKFIHYPRAGSKNPTVQFSILNLIDFNNISTVKITPPLSIYKQDHYFTSAGWISGKNDKISIMWMNRAQNLSILSICKAPNWNCIEIHAERSVENTWLNIPPHPIFSEDANSFLMLAPVQEENLEYYTHIKHITLNDEHIAVISHGKFEVDSILAWDFVNHIVYTLLPLKYFLMCKLMFCYYEAISKDNMRQKHIFRVYDPSVEAYKRFEAKCITCELHSQLKKKKITIFENCSYFNALV